MEAKGAGKGARHSPIMALMASTALAVFVVFILLLTGFFGGGAGQVRGYSPAQGNAGLHPLILANTVIDINRSQSSGTYVNEYITQNNSTTLTKLPVSITVVAATCRWITVVNLTTAASPASIFHNVKFGNITTLNNTGSTTMKPSGFKICGSGAVWVNYVYWTYSVYDFSATGLPINATISAQNFSTWPGTSTAPPKVTASISNTATARFIIASNLTNFTVVIPTPVSGATTCDPTGQICSYTQYSFTSATDTANVTKKSAIVFNTASGLRVSAAYENWTVGYSNASVSINSQLGGFFVGTASVFTMVFVTFWWAWVVILLVALVLVLYLRADGRMRRR